MNSEWWSGFIQVLLAHWGYFLIMTIGSALIAWGRKKEWKWASPILYGLAAFAFLGYILLGGFHTQNLGSLPAKELELKLREPLDYLDYKTGRISDEKANFNFSVVDVNGIKLTVVQRKSYPSTINLMLGITVAPDIQQKIGNLNEKEKIRLRRELKSQILKQGFTETIQLEPFHIIIIDSILKGRITEYPSIHTKDKDNI